MKYGEDLCEAPSFRLMSKEVQTFELIVQGLSNKDIAARMYTSESLAKRRVTRVLEYFGCESRAALLSQLLDPAKVAAAVHKLAGGRRVTD